MSPFSFIRNNVDERFLLHRYKSTSHAGIAAALIMAGWFFYDQIVNGVIRVDFVILLSVMALVKIAFLVFYRFND